MEPFVMKNRDSNPALFFLSSWMERYPYISAGFTSRQGGVSDGHFDSLNCALHVNDIPDSVVNNRKRLAESLGIPFQSWTFAEQVHGNDVIYVTDTEKGKGRETRQDAIQCKDAFITDKRGICLAMLYADCVPLYFLDPIRQVIGMAHAGWKGTVAQIAARAINAMTERFGSLPENILCVIGPSIGACCYEVDDAVMEKVRQLDVSTDAGENGEPLSPVSRPANVQGKYMLDLKQLNRQIMIKAGILPGHIELSQLCTSCRTDLFFSHRKEGGRTGRMAAWIYLR